MIRFPDLIRKHAFHSPGKKATHFEGRDFSWSEFSERIHGMAQALRDLGIGSGERIAYLGLNSHWLVEMYFVPSLIGAISVPLNYRLAEDEMVELMANCSPRVLIVDRHYQSRATSLMQRCGSLETLIFADWDAPGPDLPPDVLIYDDLIVPDVREDAFADCATQSDDTMILIYTSGTTGVPKGVMLSHANMLANAMGTGPMYGYTSEDVLLLTGPLFHVATGSRAFTSILYGTTMVVQAKFDVLQFMEIVQAQRVTAMTMVPTMFQMILDHPEFDTFDFSSLRCVSYGSAPMPVALMQRLLDKIPGVTFAQGYGMTEASPVICVLTPEDHQTVNGEVPKIASVGKPVPYCDIRIVDETGAPVGPGQIGEITVRGPQVMQGYWERPDETERSIRNGFYHTGDAAYFDDDGYVFLAGRTKEMIISGGENVYPIETENCLSKHPAIAASAVLGLPHEMWGEMVFGVVALKPGQVTSEAELIAHCRERIAHYKVPKAFKIWEGPLPLNPANKIDKIKIRDMILCGPDGKTAD